MANEQNPFDLTEPLPPEYEAIQRRLLQDGAHWRAGLPSTERLERQLDTLMRQEGASPRPVREDAAPARHRRGLRLVHTPGGASSMFHGRMKTIGGAAAIAAVVLLFVFLFYGFAGHSTTGNGHTSTPTVPSTSTPGGAQRYAGNEWATPQIAPSNPQVVYQLTQDNPSAPMKLQRSADGGKTWKSAAIPAGSSVDTIKPSIKVSPLDAQFVFLTVVGTRSDNGCQLSNVLSGQSSLSGGQNNCSVQYLSQDGGEHWNVLQLPVPTNALGDTNEFGAPSSVWSNSLSVFHVQGNRLYSVLGPYTQNGAVLAATAARLVTSTDGGVTWQLIDAGVGDGSGVCDYAPDPASATIFAITSLNCLVPGISPLTLWRSDDAGAQWTQVSDLPNNTSLGMIVVSRGAGQEPLLYIDMAQMTGSGALADAGGVFTANVSGPQAGGGGISPSPTNLQVSADGGLTWQAAPTNGFLSAESSPDRPLGVLSDGSVLFAARGPSIVDGSFYAWKLGDASWHKVGPTVTNLLYAFVTTGADGKQALAIVTSTTFFSVQL